MITNAELSAVFEGRKFAWDQLEGAEPEFEEACEAPITRVVRKDPSGTVYQFKNYLYTLSTAPLACLEVHWNDLQPVTSLPAGAPNTTWPETCAKKALSALVKPAADGEEAVVNKVNELAGSVSFVALPEAKAHLQGSAVIMAMQNNGQKKGGEANFAFPAAGTGANCGGIVYQVPKTGTSLDLDWSGVYGAKPSVGGKSYPLCMLTYDLAFNDYSSVGFSEAQEVTTRDYLREYVVQEAGQSAAQGAYYSALPSSAEAQFNVSGAAINAAKNIAY